MPLLKRKRVPLVEPPRIEDVGDPNTPVYVIPFTNEIFLNYEDFFERQKLYKQPIWQCETTGRINLTYQDALASERREAVAMESKLAEGLKREILERVQGSTSGVDSLSEELFNAFKDRYVKGEAVNIMWDSTAYTGKIIEVLKPTTNGISAKHANGGAHTPPGTQYRVQLTGSKGETLPEYERIVATDVLSRDRLVFSKNLLRNFIRASASRESYVNAPWVLKPSVAKKYNIDNSLTAEQAKTREKAIIKQRKRRRKTDEEIEKEKEEKEEASVEKPVVKAKPKEKVDKRNIDDLDLPSGGGVMRPRPARDFAIPQELFEPMLIVWSFLMTFGKPLHLSPFSIDDFECALRHNTHHPKCALQAECYAVLLNAIIKERLQGRSVSSMALNHFIERERERESTVDTEVSSTGGGAGERGGVDVPVEIRSRGGTPALSGVFNANDSAERMEEVSAEDVARVGRAWDKQTLPAGRKGWEAVLVGCLTRLANRDTFPHLDAILSHLLEDGTSPEDVEARFPSLQLTWKLEILEFLIGVVNGTTIIKGYMEECNEYLTTLNRELREEIPREKKRIQALWKEFEQTCDEAGFANGMLDEDDEPAEEDTPRNSEADEDEEEQLRTRLTPRQLMKTLQRKQQEREAEERRRQQERERQRKEQKARDSRRKQLIRERKELREEERAVKRREEQLERDVRRHSVIRMQPLGRDRNYFGYYFMDGIGSAPTAATARVYVQPPFGAYVDLLTEKGLDTVREQMRRAGYDEEDMAIGQGGWSYYQTPEEIDALIEWLRANEGKREPGLRNALVKMKDVIGNSMRKRNMELAALLRNEQNLRRSTRTTTAASTLAKEPYMTYINKLVR
ncbi:uncharacterized protein VTP21DRAFT_2176 [Calcarisporiella thermophila]|uniref:uncharacterized protein n=1 Tax=Calcarisporiella thermophila TaxID=911321 RepID=UPI0037439681